ncbi:MAG: VWA domain-containing protein [Leptospiraceae bacterium]|nr:VWA domain-containing protein [Leptospiraceae bacterium]MCP5510872.1 VWA domain-containing protein [Leptospiraceae bacterium]
MNTLERPEILLFLIPLFVYSIYYFKKKLYLNRQELLLSSQKKTSGFGFYDFWAPIFLASLRYLALVLIVVAAAGPGLKTDLRPDEKNGIDMMIALDVSGSMSRSTDFLPRNRLEVSKELISEFIKKRNTDRIGLVVFGGAAYLQAPLTGDMNSLLEIITDIHEASVGEQGTAIGDAIVLSTYRLRNSKAKSKVILLLTDGVSNAGRIDVKTASETAAEFNMKIYTVGIGKELFDAQNSMEVDFESLENISKLTGGVFYRATDSDQLQEVLNDVDRLEKTYMPTKPVVIIESAFEVFLIPAIFILILELLIKSFYLRHHI